VRDREFEALRAAEDGHWWYRGRRRVVDAQLRRLALPPRTRILDAGCGTGRMLDELARYGEVAGVEVNETGVELARARGHERVEVAPIEAIPFPDESFDLITCLDVVEHTPDDRRTFAELRRVTRPGGRLLVTVPAYQSLWSSHDVANEHHRRYRRRTLRDAARAAGWRPVSSTYFNSVLLPPAAAVRLVRGRGDADGADARSDLALTPPALNGALELPLRLEATLVRRGGRLPFGLSLMAVFERPAGP